MGAGLRHRLHQHQIDNNNFNHFYHITISSVPHVFQKRKKKQKIILFVFMHLKIIQNQLRCGLIRVRVLLFCFFSTDEFVYFYQYSNKTIRTAERRIITKISVTNYIRTDHKNKAERMKQNENNIETS